MHVKSAYREKAADKIPPEPVEPPHTPEIKIDGEHVPVDAMAETQTPPENDGDAATEAMEAAMEADSAKTALMRQIEALKQAEYVQRQHAAHMAQAARPLSREERLGAWKEQGLTDKEAAWLQDHPEAIDFPQISGIAANEALALGHERDSDAYFRATAERFEHHMRELRARAAAQETPQFFKPPEPRVGSMPSEGSIVSAPVSRGVPSGGPRVETNPNRVRLSAAEIEIARASGISPAEYAKHRLELERQKRTGQRQ